MIGGKKGFWEQKKTLVGGDVAQSSKEGLPYPIVDVKGRMLLAQSIVWTMGSRNPCAFKTVDSTVPPSNVAYANMGEELGLVEADPV
ncbi:hypothetical protein GDO78_017283 [Eleutherodactylus coqui]|uniref:Uncharacterized protein n=1 Tax=Eleutherodactylus coqui TaxID=57060 RepID=A0A8J6E3I4_ELECQ|nr:hypothetical protein GDO78_017283 [Eleutherodactylus coqui]